MNTILYRDRSDAGKKLSAELGHLANLNPLILAIPRGGVIVAYEVARGLKAELDIVVPRKLRAPDQPELAIGAVMQDGEVFLNENVVSALGVPREYIARERDLQLSELRRRLAAYRGNRPYPKIQERTIVVVDDGAATGATLIAALRWVRAQKAKKTIAAIPVAPRDIFPRLEGEADEVVCPYYEDFFYTVGQFYRRFEEVSDEEVIGILKDFWH